MGLYSLVIEYDGKRYSTQVTATSADSALKRYFDVRYPKSGREFFGKEAPVLSAKDIVLFTPMSPLTNMWACQAGQDGKYVSVICSRTVSRQNT